MIALLGTLLWLATATDAGAEEPARWWHGELALGLAGDYSSGDYGDPADTDILYVPVSATYLFDGFPLTAYDRDQLELRLTVPYLRIRGPGSVVPGTVIGEPFAPGRTTESGLGDILLRATYLWFPPRRRLPLVELMSEVKIPTADEDKRLGTGERDVTLMLGLSQRFGDFSPFLRIGYRFMGDPPGLDLDDRLLASVGVGRRLGARFGAGISYDFREAASSRVKDSHEIVPYASITLSPKLRIGPYAVIGLSDGSPDFGVGLQARFSVPIR